MTRTKFKDLLSDLGMTQKGFSELVGYSYQAVKQWKDGEFPKWVPMMLDYLQMIKQNSNLAQKYNFC